MVSAGSLDVGLLFGLMPLQFTDMILTNPSSVCEGFDGIAVVPEDGHSQTAPKPIKVVNAETAMAIPLALGPICLSLSPNSKLTIPSKSPMAVKVSPNFVPGSMAGRLRLLNAANSTL